MSHTKLILHATIVNEGKQFVGNMLVEGDKISKFVEDAEVATIAADETIDATGLYLLPGLIDCHVHFREPGLTHKADILHESRAAAAGGVTTVFDMPNTVPQTTTLDAYAEKMDLFAAQCCVNYGVFFGATNDNIDVLQQLDATKVCGIKLFMGSSTGNMLVDQEEALRKLFQSARLPIMTHCEDTNTINANMAAAKAAHGDDPAVELHPEIRSAEACYLSTKLAVDLAREYGAQLHVAHLTTADELQLFDADSANITAEVCVPHLVFTDADYATLGARIKCNPAVKGEHHRAALRAALADGRIFTIGTDHAPHLITEKQGGAAKAVSGMPMVQFSLVSLLQLVNEGVLTLERLVALACHHPAQRFSIAERGYLRPGYKADFVMVRPDAQWTLSAADVESKCKWSPLEGRTFDWKVVSTYCNGKAVYKDGAIVSDAPMGEAVSFDRA